MQSYYKPTVSPEFVERLASDRCSAIRAAFVEEGQDGWEELLDKTGAYVIRSFQIN